MRYLPLLLATVLQAHCAWAQDLLQTYRIAQESIEVADAQLKTTELELSLATHGFTAGLHTITDVHEAKARAELARSQRIATQNELESKHTELEKLLGQESKALAPLKNSITIPKPAPENAILRGLSPQQGPIPSTPPCRGNSTFPLRLHCNRGV